MRCELPARPLRTFVPPCGPCGNPVPLPNRRCCAARRQHLSALRMRISNCRRMAIRVPLLKYAMSTANRDCVFHCSFLPMVTDYQKNSATVVIYEENKYLNKYLLIYEENKYSSILCHPCHFYWCSSFARFEKRVFPICF